MTVDAHLPRLRALHRDRSELAVAAFFADLAETLRPDLAAGTVDVERDLNGEVLASVIYDRGRDTATDYGNTVAGLFARRSARFDPDLMDGWLTAVAARSASNILDTFEADLEAALDDDEADPDDILDRYETTKPAGYADSWTTTFGMFGAHEGARASAATAKIWQVTSGSPRTSHAAVDGQQVGLQQTFSNGMRWPGDPAGGVEEVAGCLCALMFL